MVSKKVQFLKLIKNSHLNPNPSKKGEIERGQFTVLTEKYIQLK